MPAIRLEQLIHAYTQGAFPMANESEGGRVGWYTADPRAIFPIAENDPAGAFHTPRSLRKLARKRPLRLAIDQDFNAVIRACAEPAAGREQTWINPDIIDTFNEAYACGFAHCVAGYRGHQLVGGIYGLALGGAFFAESMFSRQPNASKLCLLELVHQLTDRGFTLLDVQFTNPHLEQFGVTEISNEDYLQRLEQALRLGRLW